MYTDCNFYKSFPSTVRWIFTGKKLNFATQFLK
jgi:hypothetical protein